MLYKLKKNKTPLYTLPLPSRAPSDINRTVEEAKSWIRRNLRSWPHEHSLEYEIKSRDGKLYMEFHFLCKYAEENSDHDDDDYDYTRWQW